MEKYEIRKEFIKLKNKGHSYSRCRKILKAKLDYETTASLAKKSDNKNRNLEDLPRKPNKI